MPYGIVYKITNKINHKIYVGLTTKTLEERWKNHLKAAFCKNSKDHNALFKKAIRKYGKDNWILEVIDNAETAQELKEKEVYWIKTLNSYAFDINGWGYNSTRGGDFVNEQNDVAINQFDVLSGKKIKTYKSLTEVEKEIGYRIENYNNKKPNKKDYIFLTPDKTENMSEEEQINFIHSLHPHLVYQLDLKGNFVNLYRNTAQAAKAIRCSQGNLIETCLGNRQKCKEYQWVYQKDIKNRLGKPIRDLPTLGIPIIQYGLNGKKIKEWPNAVSAALELTGKKETSHICSCCKQKRQQALGFQWRYADDEIETLPEIYIKRPVRCLETNEIFPTAYDAAKKFNYAQQTVKRSCMGEKTIIPHHFVWDDK